MNVIGDWKVVQVMACTKDGLSFVDAAIAAEQDREMKMIAGAVLRFSEDGKINTLFPIPANVTPEQLAQAKKQKGITLVDDKWMITDKPKDWKEEDGKIMLDSGVRGTLLDEEVNSWVEFKEDGDGIFNYMGLFRIQKI